MSWMGWVQYDGNELVNVARTEAYAANGKLGWFRAVYGPTTLQSFLGDSAYTNPVTDNAPWYDPDFPESANFYGLYPLNMAGTEDSSVDTDVFEKTTEGGVVGKARRTTKAVVFSAVLIGGSEAANDYGMRWLNQVLSGALCSEGTCSGVNMCFLSSEPLSGAVCRTTVAITPQIRTLRRLGLTDGATVTSKRSTTDNGAIWTVSFTVTAGDPYQYSQEVPIVKSVLDPAVANPYVSGVTGGTYTSAPAAVTDVDCGARYLDPINDPNCPAIIAPPDPPSVPIGCFTQTFNWQRRKFTIPQQYVPNWATVVPEMVIYARTADVRNLRIRFYVDLFADGDITTDPCAFCGDFLISYVPLGSALVFDAVARRVYVRNPGGFTQAADSLVYKTDGTPFEWPELTCGTGYVVTLDTPTTLNPPVVDLSLYGKIA